jgi:hypothetical protein
VCVYIYTYIHTTYIHTYIHAPVRTYCVCVWCVCVSIGGPNPGIRLLSFRVDINDVFIGTKTFAINWICMPNDLCYDFVRR